MKRRTYITCFVGWEKILFSRILYMGHLGQDDGNPKDLLETRHELLGVVCDIQSVPVHSDQSVPYECVFNIAGCI